MRVGGGVGVEASRRAGCSRGRARRDFLDSSTNRHLGRARDSTLITSSCYSYGAVGSPTRLLRGARWTSGERRHAAGGRRQAVAEARGLTGWSRAVGESSGLGRCREGAKPRSRRFLVPVGTSPGPLVNRRSNALSSQFESLTDAHTLLHHASLRANSEQQCRLLELRLPPLRPHVRSSPVLRRATRSHPAGLTSLRERAQHDQHDPLRPPSTDPRDSRATQDAHIYK